MPINRRQARELATRSELDLIGASYSEAISKLTPRVLKSNIARTRKLRDKHRDLLRRQRLASRARTGTKHGRRPDSNARTVRKAQLFEETLGRFTARLEALEAAERRKGRKPSAPRRAAAPGKGPKPPRAARRKQGQAALLQKARTPRMKAMQAHVSSRGRRNQARRDSR